MESLQPSAAAVDPGPRPVMPREVPLSVEEVRAVRRFHLGATADGAAVASQGSPAGLLPAALWPYRDAGRPRSAFPLFLGPPAAGGEPAVCMPAGELLARAARTAGIGGALAEALPKLERALAGAVGEGGRAIAAAGERVLDELAAAGAAREPLEADLARLVAAVPAGGRWIALDAATPLHLARSAALDRLLPAWEAFRVEAAGLAERLAVVLAGDRLHEPEREPSESAGDRGDVGAPGEPAPGRGGAKQAAQAIAGTDRLQSAGPADGPLAALGELGGRFIDRAALAGVLARRRGGALEPGRRARLVRALEALAGSAAGEPPEPLLFVHSAGGAAKGARRVAEAAGWRAATAADPCAAAAERFDREAAALAEVLAAARLARLELSGDYDPALHGPWLERFDWQAFSRDELALLPPVAALVPADLAAGAGMVALSRLLLSGRPVQIVVTVAPAANPGAAAAEDPAARLAGYRFEPAYLGIGHREALVQQTAAARPLHALEGFRRAARAASAALHVVAMPAAGTLDGELVAAAAIEGRAHPLFHYDPEAGRSWAHRFDFAGNPAPDADWPVYELAAEAADGSGETRLRAAFTFADFALLDPSFAPCFRALPAGAAAEELIPLAEWLALGDDEAAARVPFVWAVRAADDDGGGELRKLAVDRPLALACRDRLDFWRTLQELSGAKSGYAREAAEQAREEEIERAREERERLEARHAAELARIERAAAERLAGRLTAMLLAPEPGGLLGAASAEPGAATTQPLPALAGGDVEQVTAALLGLLGDGLAAAATRPAAEPAPPADPRVEQAAAQLLAAIGGAAGLARDLEALETR